MKTFWKLNIIMLLAAACALSALAQSDTQIERELVAGIKDLQAYTIYGGNYDEEKLTKAQQVFEQKLVKYTAMPSTLKYSFAELGELLTIASSADGRFRIYSWDMQDGGTMHRFGRVFQFAGVDGKVHSMTEKLPPESMGRGYATDIFAVNTKDGPVYIVASTVVASSRNFMQSAELYRIRGTVLDDKVKLIHTSSGMTNSLRFEYDNFSVMDRKDREKLILFDDKTGTLRIPVVIKDEEYPDGRVTDKFIGYRFNGKYFEKAH